MPLVLNCSSRFDTKVALVEIVIGVLSLIVALLAYDHPRHPALVFSNMEPEWAATIIAVLGTALSSAGAFEAIRAFVRRDIKDVELAPLDQDEVDEALVALRNRLDGGGGASTTAKPPPNPTPGELEARAIMAVFSEELTDEARRVAKRAKAERPSAEHVRVAADRIGVLRDRAGAASDLALALGSILVGAAVSYQVNLLTGGEGSSGAGLWAAIALAVGVGIVVAAGAVKWRRG